MTPEQTAERALAKLRQSPTPDNRRLVSQWIEHGRISDALRAKMVAALREVEK